MIEKKGGTYYEYVVFHGMCLCCHTDGDRLFVCSSTAVAVRCIGRCDGIRVSLYDDLSDRNFAVDGGNRHEPVHQRAGLLDRLVCFPSSIGAVANLLLDPLFIFVFGFGVQGAAIATVISQTLSAVFVLYFLTRKSELKVRFVRKDENF